MHSHAQACTEVSLTALREVGYWRNGYVELRPEPRSAAGRFHFLKPATSLTLRCKIGAWIALPTLELGVTAQPTARPRLRMGEIAMND